MTPTSRTFRVFLSSTFNDLREERNALHRDVFPVLRQLAMAHGARFQVIDLRWGVTDNAAFDQRTVAICLEEIRRCQSNRLKPNFLILLGDRYGWRPLPDEIPAATFDSIQRLYPRDSSGLELLKNWYQRDDNALPPVYYLKSRTGKWRSPDSWKEIEQKLLAVLEVASSVLPADSHLWSWGLSATEMEIHLGALEVANGRDHVYCFARTIRGFPTDLPASQYFDYDPSGALDSGSQKRLSTLKNELSRSLGSRNYLPFPVRWAGDRIAADHLSDDPAPGEFNLCREVRSALEQILRRELESLKEQDPLDREIDEHASFSAQRSAGFTGRKELLARIARHLEEASENPLVVWGPGGSGKSALMSQASIDACDRFGTAQVIRRFIGATPDSTSARGLLESCSREISRKYGWDETTVPTDYRDLVQDFSHRLLRIPEDRPLAVFLDGLDQLSAADYARSLSWLPNPLPPAARLVVSTLPAPELGYEVLAARNAGQPEKMLEIPAMPVADSITMLKGLLKETFRTLQPRQQSNLIGGLERCPLPLYVKLISEEARLWKSHDPPAQPGSDIPNVIQELFARLSQPANHNSLIVSRSLGYLASGKIGLTEDELLDLLSRDATVMDTVRRLAHHEIGASDPLPVVLWSRLYFDLKPYLSERAADRTIVLSFFHRQFKEIVDAQFLGGGEGEARHRQVAEYLADMDTVVRAPGHANLNVRKLSELPYQQRKAKMWRNLEETLCNLEFMQAKCHAGLIYDLIADYDATLRDPELPSQLHARIEEFGRFVRARSHVLARHPGLFSQLALNEPDVTAPAKAAQEILRPDTGVPHFRWVNKLQSVSSCVLTLTGHRDTVNTCAVSPDGKRIVSGASDAQLIIWNASSGEQMRTLPHPASVEICLFSPDGRRILAGTRDGHICIWDAFDYQLLFQEQVHTDPIANAAFSRNGTRFATTSWDCTLAIRDTATGGLIRSLKQESQVLSCDFHPDGGTILCGTNEGRLRIWDLKTWQERRGPSGHQGAIYRCMFSKDGGQIFSCSQDGTLKRWNAFSFEPEATYSGHRAAVWSFALSPDETRMVSGSEDKSLIVWDLRTCQSVAFLREHSGAIWGVSYGPDSNTVVSAAWDWTVKVWSLASAEGEPAPAGTKARLAGEPLAEQRVAGPVISCDVSPDGRYVAAGSADGHVRLWHTKTASLQADIPAHADYVLMTKFSPDGHYLLTGTYTGFIRLLDTSSRRFVADLGGHEDYLLSASFSQDGRGMLTCSGSKIQIWDMTQGEPRSVATWTSPESGFTMAAMAPDGSWAVTGDGGGLIELRAVPSGEMISALGRHAELGIGALSRDGTMLATVANVGTLKLWSISEKRQSGSIQAHERAIDSCNFSADGKKLVTTSWDGLVKIWQTGFLENPIVLAGHVDQLQDACFTPDGERVVSASMDGTVRFWNAATGSEIGTFLAQGDSASVCVLSPDGQYAISASHRGAARIWSISSGALEGTLRGHTLEVNACAFSPDGHYVCTASADQTVKLWDWRTGRELLTYRGHAGPVTCCAFSAEGGRIASGSRDGTVRIWSANSDELLAVLKGHDSWIRHILWNGQHVISSGGGAIFVWDSATGAIVESFSSNADIICSMAIDASGSCLICGMVNGAAAICQLGSGSPMIPLGGHAGPVRCCALSRDGSMAYTGSMDRTGCIWDVRERKLTTILAGHEHWIVAAAFSPGGGLLFSSSQDQYLKVWDVRTGGQLCEYWAGAPAISIAVDSNSKRLTLGCATGQVHILEFVSSGSW